MNCYLNVTLFFLKQKDLALLMISRVFQYTHCANVLWEELYSERRVGLVEEC